MDCARVPNGDNRADACGSCDANPANDCVQDCRGGWGGSAAFDACGVCGGNNGSCADCRAVAFGPNSLDHCGSCDTDSSNDCRARLGGALVHERSEGRGSGRSPWIAAFTSTSKNTQLQDVFEDGVYFSCGTEKGQARLCVMHNAVAFPPPVTIN